MKYDFTTILDRHGKDSIAVDPPEDGFARFPKARDGFSRIPMWVADMNFATVPTVQEEIIRRTGHPTFGYFAPRDEYFDAIIDWHTRRNGVEGLKKEHIGYENGVIGGVLSAVNALASRGDSVLLHAPTYIGFTGSLENNGYHIVLSPLVRDADGIWRMDYEDMENKIVENKIHVAIFCSPHNPTGRVWERAELEKAMAVYQKYDVYVISDEIWSDIILPQHTGGSQEHTLCRHIPLQSISADARQRTVALYAPSKTFNLAGLIGAYHIIYSDYLRDRVDRESSLSHYNGMNLLSMYALIGAYRPEGYEWVDELCEVLSQNVDYACAFFSRYAGEITVAKPQGTYMLFLDCTAWCQTHGKTIDDLLTLGQEYGVLWQDGRPFHGPCHIRMNLALPSAMLKEALSRLEKYVLHDK